MGTPQTDGIPPTYSKKPTIRQEDEGRRLLFECRILADPKPTVTWFHDNNPVKESARCKVRLDKDGNAYFSILEINDVSIEDAGKYKVTAKNELGESHASISLNFDSEDEGVPAEGTRPVFTEKPTIKGADNFSKVTFECRLIADPKPTIEWFHNGKPISDGGRYKYGLVSDKHNHVVSLEVQKIAAGDGGEYKAVAKNKHGDGNANITLNFEDDKPQIPKGKTPRFPKKPTIKQEGENLVLECILEADPLPAITWFLGTTKIKDGKRHKIQQNSKGADMYLLTLEIKDPVAEDGGNYRCNAINDLGESNANIALNFQGGDAKSEGLAPEFLEKPRIIPKEGGKLIIMQCKVKAKPAPKITWYQGTKLVKETNRVQAKVIEGSADEFTVSLEVRDPSKDDGGAYKCHMVNEHGELNANLNLDIQAEKAPAGEAPTFVEKPKITPEDGGNRIIMECKVRASPKPDITWFCDGSQVKESTRIKQTITQEKDVYHIKLELKNLEFTDAGLYKCNVKNVHGESNANLTLNIELAPVIKEKPKIIKQEIHKTVIIECRVQSVSKPKCVWYKESSMVSESSKHCVRITEVTKGEYAIALEINTPTGADKGSYKMVAKNEKGEISSTAVQVDIEEEKKEPEKKKPAGEKPKVVQGLKSVTAEAGKSADFSCKIESKTKTTVTWYKGTQVIKESKDIKISFDGSTASMTIVQTTTSSSGSYKVEFVNEFGKEESSAQLTVEEKKKVEEKKVEKKEEKKEEKKVEKKEEKKEEKIEVKVEKKEEVKIEKKESLKVEKKESLKVEKKESLKVEKKESLKVEKKEEVKVEKKEEVKVEKKEEVKVEKKESLKVEQKVEKKVEKKGETKVTKTDEKKTPAIPQIAIEETKEPAKKGKGPQVPVVIKEPSPDPGSRKASTDKGILIDETGKTKKLRPGEMLEVQTQKRRKSIDVRRASVTEIEELIDKPCTKLKPVPATDKCAPVIIDFQTNYSAVEGATAYLSFQVEGNPVPKFHFWKGISEIFDGGRYKIFTDGKSNTVALCIRKSKAPDEGKYQIIAYNEVGEDKQEVNLFVSGESGMDFRAMLKKKQYAKWKEEQEKPDANLKAPDKERRPSLRETKKKDEFVKLLVDSRAKEGKDKKLRLEAVFSKLNVKAKWYKGKEELFLGKHYHMQSEGDLHVLVINNPNVEDSGRYKVECMGITTNCIVTVDEADPVYLFTKKLNETTEAYTTKDGVLECAVNDYKAIVTWYKDGSKIEASDKYVIMDDPLGRKILKIIDLTFADCGQYMCKINHEEKTETKLVVTDQLFKFIKPLKSIKVTENSEVNLECELDDWEGKVTWFKGEKELKPDPAIEQVAQVRRRRLVFKSVRLSDEGKYTCKTNADSTVCEMIVEPANKIVKKLKDCTLLERSKSILEVEMLDKKAPVEWFKNGEPIKPTERVHLKMYDDGKHHLIFEVLQMEDFGEYTCQAKDLKTSCKLTVEQAEKAPVIKLEKFDFIGDSGKPYILEVPYEIIGTRTGKAVAKLFRNGQPVTPKEIDIVVKDEKVLITFRKAIRGQTGKYDFTLTNSQGEAKCELDLNVLDVPTPPEGPLDVFDVYRDRCKLAWKPCKDTGGMPLTHYLIERQDLGARGGWAEVATTQDTKFDCTDLTPKKEYKFRVRAINEKGSSQPLVAPKNTFAKDPYDEPSKPGVVEIEDWDAGRVDIKWTPPESDGGAPITSYIVEYKDKFSGEWTTGPEVGSNELKCRVDGLKEGVQYQFRVKAVNKAGPGEPSDPSKPVIAKARYVKPFIIGDEVKGMIVKKGQMIKFEIQFGGEPSPTVKWSKDLQELMPSNKITIDNTTKDTTIIVKSVERKDSGKYTLTLTNSTGSISSWGDVIVLDKPTAPRGPLNADEIRANHVKLSWKRPEDDGGQELKGYVIEKMDVESGRWVPAGEVGPHDNTFAVDGLTPKKKYKFRVKAKNKDGESPALVTEAEIEARNPYDEPGKPPRPEIVDYDNTKVDLKWVSPDNDGGRPILHYIVEMKDKFSVAWTQVLKTEDNKCRGTVEGLKENSIVQFRVRAVNKAGIGEPSDPTNNHTVKHRNLKPYIDRTNLKNQVIKVGRSIKFDVDVKGEPPPEITWSFSDRKVVQDEHIKVENRDYHTEFQIMKGKRKHSGKYTISATNASGKDMVTVDVTLLGKPSKPEGPLEVSDVHKEGCKLKWNKPKDDGGAPVQQYEVEKFDKETGRWTRVGKVSGDKPEMEVTGLTPGKEYQFRVSAINEEGESEPLETLKPIIAKNPFDEPGKPGVPEFVDWDNCSVDLKWEVPKSDGGSPITKYIIEKKEKFCLNWEKATEVLSDKPEAKVIDLKEKSEYQFRVIAVNAAGPSEPSDATKHHLVKHRKLKPHIDRTNLEATTIRKGNTLKLDVSIRGEPAPKVTWYLNGKVVENSEGREIADVEYNTKLLIHVAQRKYSGKYKIVAENEHGKDEAEVEITILGAPSKPKGPLQVNDVHAKGCKLKWEPPEDDGGKPVNHYQVEKMDTATGSWVPVGRAEADKPEIDVPGLIPGKEYLFRVKAINAEGESEPLVADKPIVAKNPFEPAGAPGIPDIVDWDENMVELKWQPPRNDGGAPITGYVIERKERFGTSWDTAAEVEGAKPEGKVTGLVKGRQYEFRVKAINKAGEGEPSEATKPHTAKARNLAPKINRANLQDIAIRAGNSIKLDVEVEGEPAPTITWIFSEKPVEPDDVVQYQNEDYATHMKFTKLTRQYTGKYTIRAVNKNGRDEATVNINVLSKPSRPQGPLEVVDVHAKGCKLQWEPPKDDGGTPIEGYAVEKQDVLTGRWVPVGKVDKDTTEMNVPGLEEGKKYHFRVKAINNEGESDPLETDRTTLAKNPFEKPGCPGIPEIVDYDKDFVQLKWDRPAKDGNAPITGYIIEKKDRISGQWVKAAEVTGPEGKVGGLIEGEKYEFRVKAVNKAGPGEPSEATPPHLAKPRFLKPRIDRTNLKNMAIKIGQTVSLDINIKGEPPPEIVWQLNDVDVKTSETIRIDNADYNTKFYLLRATRKESGIYTIIATNKMGKDEAKVEIFVMGKPSKPQGPLDVSDVHKEGCTLKWGEPEDDGGCPIEHYEIEKNG